MTTKTMPSSSPEVARQALLEGLLDRLDARQGEAGGRRRVYPRATYRRDLVLEVHHPGGSTSVCNVTTRDISAGGVGFLHNGFLHLGTRCALALRRHLGGEDLARGEVVTCQHVGGVWHYVGMRFDCKIFPKLYLDPESASRIAGQCVEPESLVGTVLYLDPRALDRRLMEHHLKPTRLQLYCVESLEGARPLLSQTDPRIDLVVFDLELPANDPTAASRVMEGLRAGGFTGPVALITADTHPEKLRHARDAGVTGVLTKPYDRDKLLSQLADWLGITSDSNDNEPIYSEMVCEAGMAPLLVELVQSARSIRREIKDAVSADDLNTVRRLCLDLKGVGSGYGYRILSDVAVEALKSLESTGSVEESAVALQRLQEVCSRLSADDPAKAAA